jgi:hypothetical protein
MTLLLPNVYIFDGESDLMGSALHLWTRAFAEGLRRRKPKGRSLP